MKLAVLLWFPLLLGGCDTPWAAATRNREGITWEEWKAGIRTKEQLQEQASRREAERGNKRQQLKAELEASRKIKEPFLVRGLSSEDAKTVWGPPNRVNASEGSFGHHEQWVYYGLATDPLDGVTYYINEKGWLPGKSLYLYFDNGKLTGWQIAK